jgi:ABC-2 type transport system permease protein
MFRQIMVLAIKEMKVIGSDREALLLLFAMPMFFIFVMSLALQGVFDAGTATRPLEVLIVNEHGGLLAEQMIADLRGLAGLALIETADGAPLDREKAEGSILRGKHSLALIFGAGVSEGIQPGSPSPAPSVTLISDPATHIPVLNSLKAIVQTAIERRVLMANLPRYMQKAIEDSLENIPYDREAFSREIERRFESVLREVNAAAAAHSRVAFEHVFPKRVPAHTRPSSAEQNVPAYTIFGVFFIVLTLSAGIQREKQEGTFQRILSAPLKKSTLLIGKLVPYYCLNLIQIGLMFSVAFLLFDLPVRNLSAMILVSLALAAAANGLGLLTAALGKTESQVNSLSILFAITLAALGGMMVPTFLMPGFMQTLAMFTPHAWALEGYHDVMLRGFGMKEVLPETGILMAFAALFFAVALWRFRF